MRLITKKNNYYSSIKLSFRDTVLWVAMLAAVVVVFALSMMNYQGAKKSTEDSFETSLKDRTEQCASEIQHIFQRKFDILTYVASQPEIKGMDPEQQKQYLADNAEVLGFESIFIMDSNGTGYYFDEDKVRDQSNEQFFNDIMENDQYITAPFYREVQKQSISTVCEAIYNGDQKVGAICGVIDLGALYDSVQDIRGDYNVTVLGSNGLFVASNDMDLVAQQKTYKTYYKNSKKMLNFLDKGLETEDTTVGESEIGGTAVYVSTADVDYCHWKVCMIASKKKVMEDIQSIMNTQFMSIGLMVFVLICIFVTYRHLLVRERVTYVDAKSGVGNRAKCNMEIGKIDDEQGVTTMLVDFSVYKYDQLKESLGAMGSETILKDVGNILDKSFGNYGFVGRVTGDNFIAIFNGQVDDIYKAAVNEMNDQLSKFNARENATYQLALVYGNGIRYASAGESIGKTSDEMMKEAVDNKEVMRSSME